MKSLIILVDYFGHWPVWMPLFLASCAANPSVNWVIHSDCMPPQNGPLNVEFVHISWQDYKEKVSSRLSIRFDPDHPYSICNVRPAFGIVHEEHIRKYDFFGWGDLDVIYGDLAAHYETAMYSADAISNDARICSGHLMILRNVDWLRQAFTLIPSWKDLLETKGPTAWIDSLDESRLSGILSPDVDARRELAVPGTGSVPDRYWQRSMFENQWVTPFVPSPWLDGNYHHPEVWLWRAGRVTNTRDAPREFPYLHLMNFQSGRYVNRELYGTIPTWANSNMIVDFGQTELTHCCIEISRDGFRKLAEEGDPSRSLTTVSAYPHD